MFQITPRELLVNKMSGEKKNLIKKMSGEEKKNEDLYDLERKPS
jgi:hypothetical protein